MVNCDWSIALAVFRLGLVSSQWYAAISVLTDLHCTSVHVSVSLSLYFVLINCECSCEMLCTDGLVVSFLTDFLLYIEWSDAIIIIVIIGPRGTWQLPIHWLHLTCHEVRYRQEAQRQPRQRGRQPNTTICHPAMSSAQWPSRHLVLWLMMRSFSWQTSAGEQRCVQPICEKLCSCTSVFHWQFSGLTLCAWPTS